MGTVPRGIEVLVKKASIDAEFKKVLLEKRSEAAKEIDLKLEPSEMQILNNIPIEQLEKSISSARVDPKHRLIFMGKVAALMLLTIGSVAIAGCATGIRPEPVSMGIRPEDVKIEAPEEKSQDKSNDTMQAPTGIRPDRPE